MFPLFLSLFRCANSALLPASEVHNVTDLSPSSLPGTEARCRQLYFHSRLSSLSRPESLERGEELGRTFGEIERMTIDSWALIGQHLSVRPSSSSCVDCPDASVV